MTLIFWQSTSDSGPELLIKPNPITLTASGVVAIHSTVLVYSFLSTTGIAQCKFVLDFVYTLHRFARFHDTQFLTFALQFHPKMDDNNLPDYSEFIEKRVYMRTSCFTMHFKNYLQCTFSLEYSWQIVVFAVCKSTENLRIEIKPA